MAVGRKTGGRQKGTPNKVTASVKAAFAEAFEKRGGVAALMNWAESNETEFYKLASKLIPMDVETSGDLSLTIVSGVPRAE